MTELVLSVSIALFVSAACSLCEAVLYSVPLRHIEGLIQRKKASGTVFKELRSRVERPITAILTLNTLANTAGAAFAGYAATAVFGSEWLGTFSACFTLAILIFSEVVPKTAGVVYYRSLLPFVSFPLKWLVTAMTPLIWLTGGITRLISKDRSHESISPDDVKILARMGLRIGTIKEHQEKVIGNILSLDHREVRDVMTPRTVVFSLSEHLTLEEAAGMSEKWEHSRFPVYDGDAEDVVGIVLTRDVFMALAKGRRDAALTDLMRPVHFVAETAPLSDVLSEFIQRRQHLFVVIDEYGGLSGIISLEDILEEILGREIIDESDQVVDKRELARQRRTQLAAGSLSR